jgi:hypothetical protein
MTGSSNPQGSQQSRCRQTGLGIINSGGGMCGIDDNCESAVTIQLTWIAPFKGLQSLSPGHTSSRHSEIQEKENEMSEN